MRPCSRGRTGGAGATSRRWWRSWRRGRMYRAPCASCRCRRSQTETSPSPLTPSRTEGASSGPPVLAPLPAAPPVRRPIIEATSPERYRVQFTIGKESHDKLRRLQELLRREIPNGDPGVIFDRAMSLLLEKVEKAKLGAAARPRTIRPGTDKVVRTADLIRTPPLGSRDIPNHVKRGASGRDGDQCAFVAPSGRRCTERVFLEFHHRQTHARGGPATVENISLRCWRHNQYEAQLVFGPRAEVKRKDRGTRPVV